jgi:hypothetical protein
MIHLMIHKTIIVLSLIVIVLVLLYSSTPEYIQEHIGTMSSVNILNYSKNPSKVDPIISDKLDSYDLGDIFYGSPYERGPAPILPMGEGLKANIMKQEAIKTRRAALDKQLESGTLSEVLYNQTIKAMKKEDDKLQALINKDTTGTAEVAVYGAGST